MLNSERLLIAAHPKRGPALTCAPDERRNRLSGGAAGPAGSWRPPGSPAKANCGVARETGSKNRTAGWLRVGEAETTSPAKPPRVILGPMQTEAVAFCSLFTKHSPGEGEEGEGRKSRARTVRVPLLPCLIASSLAHPHWHGLGRGRGRG